MNDITRVEQFNQLVRGTCVLLLVGALVGVFVYGAIVGKTIVSAEAFVGLVTFALQWWFRARDEKAQRDQPAPTAAPDTSPPPGRTP